VIPRPKKKCLSLLYSGTFSCLIFKKKKWKNLRPFVGRKGIPSISFHSRYCIRKKKKHLYFLRCFIKLVPSIWQSFFFSGSKNSKKESLEESDTNRIPQCRCTILAHDRHFRQCWQTFSLVSAFPSLIEKHRTIFIFASNGWNCHKVVQAVRTNRRDGRRKEHTSNSGVIKFIIATWPEATIRRNTLLPKQFCEFHEILNLSFNYHLICIHTVVVHTKWKSKLYTQFKIRFDQVSLLV